MQKLDLPKQSAGSKDGLSWHALYTRHQHEKSVGDILRKKGFDVFLPLYQTRRPWKDRLKTLLLPLFPLYVFIRGGVERQLQIVTTPGVCSLVMVGECVASIPDEEIEAVQKIVQNPSRVEPHPFMKCGDRVRVRSGPLHGLEGVLIRKKNVFRVVLSLELLARSAAVEVDATTIEPVSQKPIFGSSWLDTGRLPLSAAGLEVPHLGTGYSGRQPLSPS